MNNVTAGLKQSDVAMLVLIIALAGTAAFFVGNYVINTPQSRSAKVEQIVPISEKFSAPSDEVFVEDYINPTELIEISNSNNQQPFGSGSN